MHVVQMHRVPHPLSGSWRLCYLDGWEKDPTMRGLETGDAGKLAADTAAIAHGCALMLDADTMVLPWPGGPRVWRRT